MKLSQSTALEQERFDLRSILPALCNLWLVKYLNVNELRQWVSAEAYDPSGFWIRTIHVHRLLNKPLFGDDPYGLVNRQPRSQCSAASWDMTSQQTFPNSTGQRELAWERGWSMGRSCKDDATTVITARADLKTGLAHPQSGNSSAGKSCFSLSVLEARTLTNCTYYYFIGRYIAMVRCIQFWLYLNHVLDRACVAFGQLWFFELRKNEKTCNLSCNVAANELNSDVARFTTHVQTCLATNQVVDRWVVKRATSLFNSFCSDVAKQVACFLLPVFAYLKSSS